MHLPIAILRITNENLGETRRARKNRLAFAWIQMAAKLSKWKGNSYVKRQSKANAAAVFVFVKGVAFVNDRGSEVETS